MGELDEGAPEEDKTVATIGLLEVALTSGKWYYEIEILEGCNDLQPGWARRGWEKLQPGQPGQYGCGEDPLSYAACDGGFYLHDCEECGGDSKALCWSVGDTVGFMLDLDGREIRFSINGILHKHKFGYIIVDSAGYFPTMSMSSGVVDVNYGERELRFLPEGYAPVAEFLDPPLPEGYAPLPLPRQKAWLSCLKEA